MRISLCSSHTRSGRDWVLITRSTKRSKYEVLWNSHDFVLQYFVLTPPRALSTRLQLTVNDTLVFQDEIRIRPGLGSVNLLEGGAIGIAGGRVRHQLDGTAAVTSGGLGARIGVAWRGRSTLESRLGGDIDTLRFSPLLSVNVRAFADAARLLPHERWAETLRLSLNVLNLTHDHQAVRDSRGNTPLQYQPAIRDPIGRTVELELRKVL